MDRLSDLESRLPKPKFTHEEMGADARKLNSFGFFRTWDALANGDITKYKEVLKQSFNVCLTKMKLSYEQDQYQKRLIAERKQKAEVEAKRKKR